MRNPIHPFHLLIALCSLVIPIEQHLVAIAKPVNAQLVQPDRTLYAQGGATGRYCSVVYPNGRWQLFWHTAKDPCSFATCLQSGCQLGSTGTYFPERQNQVSVTCERFSRTFAGRGDRPLSNAFNSVAKPFQPSCTFQVNNAPVSARNTNRPSTNNPPPSRPMNSGNSTNTNQAAGGIAQEMVEAHNRWRSKVGVAPLRWSPQLASYAQEWADRLASSGQFNHRPQQQYGENLFGGSGRRWSPTEVVDSWGSEVKDYNYANNSCREVCGHYTQIVWAKTTEVGCAVARSGNGEVWVCNYNPPGNFVGQRPY